jgi:hypothetical protein
MKKSFELYSVLAIAMWLTTIGHGISEAVETSGPPKSQWKLGTPIVTYYIGPKITDAVAKQMVDGGFNVVCCDTVAEMDIAQRHGLRAQFPCHWSQLPQSLDDPTQRAKLDAMIDQARNHPAMYYYALRDEPPATEFPNLARIASYLRQRDPKHDVYVNLFPNWCGDEQLRTNTKGDFMALYCEYLRQFTETVKPPLLSWDHYPFAVVGDNCSRYFQNLAAIRETALKIHVPLMNIVQACSWEKGIRVPNDNEMRFSVYTTLVYGGQGISYYVYCCPGHTGGIALADGTPTPIYHALKTLNREFVAVATELQPLRSLAVHNVGMDFPGTTRLPGDAPFRLDPPVPSIPFVDLKPIQGLSLGYFGPPAKGDAKSRPTHVLVVNLDLRAEKAATLVGPADLQIFDATMRQWSPVGANRTALCLPPGGGKLLRCQAPSESKQDL